MKNVHKRTTGRLMSCALLLFAVGTLRDAVLTVSATSASELQGQIDSKQGEISITQEQIDEIKNQIRALEDEADVIDEQLEDLNAELINLMTDIGLKEEEIAAKENDLEEIAYELEQTQAEYEDAVEREKRQYGDMVLQIRAVYENGDEDLLTLLFAGKGLAEALNQMELVERLYEYDRRKLDEYTQTREQVRELQERLEGEQDTLKEQRDRLDAERAELAAERDELGVLQAQLQEQADNYEALIKKATQQAAVATKLLAQEQKELKNLQTAQREAIAREQAEAAGETEDRTEPAPDTAATRTDGAAQAASSGSGYDAIIDAADGSELGKQIAKYACQFIGNPYVAGGTSLTNGADCSGFTYRIYADFGYSIPRSSSTQRSAGTEVSYAEIQPGDIICYPGHVAMYIGGGLIVHASTARTGIKVSNALYRDYITIRRII